MPGMTKVEYKGSYRPSLLYSVGDTVFYHAGGIASNFYISLLEDNKGNTPATSPHAWIQMGGSVIQAVTSSHDAYDAAILYAAGDLVTLNDVVYMAVQSSTGVSPIGNPTYWDVAFDSSQLQWFIAPYTGPVPPGTAPNELAVGKTRIWRDTSNDKVYLVSNVGGAYMKVEMTI